MPSDQFTAPPGGPAASSLCTPVPVTRFHVYVLCAMCVLTVALIDMVYCASFLLALTRQCVGCIGVCFACAKSVCVMACLAPSLVCALI